MSGVGNGLLARAGRLTLALGLGAGVGLPASAQEAAPRPRVGLALGGGSARGIAHVGVLEWLEEHRIPVDAIAGTSMGGLIGGAYATGMSARQIQELLRDADWDLIFKADAPYRLKGYRRKEDAREFPVKLEMGLRRGGATPASCSTSRRSSGLRVTAAAWCTRSAGKPATSATPSAFVRVGCTRPSLAGGVVLRF